MSDWSRRVEGFGSSDADIGQLEETQAWYGRQLQMNSPGLRQFLAAVSARVMGGEEMTLDELVEEARRYAETHCDCGCTKYRWQAMCLDCLTKKEES